MHKYADWSSNRMSQGQQQLDSIIIVAQKCLIYDHELKLSDTAVVVLRVMQMGERSAGGTEKKRDKNLLWH